MTKPLTAGDLRVVAQFHFDKGDLGRHGDYFEILARMKEHHPRLYSNYESVKEAEEELEGESRIFKRSLEREIDEAPEDEE